VFEAPSARSPRPLRPHTRAPRAPGAGQGRQGRCRPKGTPTALLLRPAFPRKPSHAHRSLAATQVWAKSSFAQRRRLLRILQRFILENQTSICAISARDSGKPLVDAAFGEVMVTLEKIQWLCAEGERYLAPEARSAGCARCTQAA
jgi:hypothetical protein